MSWSATTLTLWSCSVCRIADALWSARTIMVQIVQMPCQMHVIKAYHDQSVWVWKNVEKHPKRGSLARLSSMTDALRNAIYRSLIRWYDSITQLSQIIADILSWVESWQFSQNCRCETNLNDLSLQSRHVQCSQKPSSGISTWWNSSSWLYCGMLLCSVWSCLLNHHHSFIEYPSLNIKAGILCVVRKALTGTQLSRWLKFHQIASWCMEHIAQYRKTCLS